MKLNYLQYTYNTWATPMIIEFNFIQKVKSKDSSRRHFRIGSHAAHNSFRFESYGSVKLFLCNDDISRRQMGKWKKKKKIDRSRKKIHLSENQDK